MESAAGRILAFVGLAAVFVCVAMVFAPPFFAALDGALQKWRRLGIVLRVVAVLMTAVATVEAQKSGMGDSNRVGIM